MNRARLGWSNRRSGAISVLSVAGGPTQNCLFSEVAEPAVRSGFALRGLDAARFGTLSSGGSTYKDECRGVDCILLGGIKNGTICGNVLTRYAGVRLPRPVGRMLALTCSGEASPVSL